MKNGTVDFEQSVYTNPEKSTRNNFFLDLDGLSPNYQEILKYYKLVEF
jgi:hypothetical protein